MFRISIKLKIKHKIIAETTVRIPTHVVWTVVGWAKNASISRMQTKNRSSSAVLIFVALLALAMRNF